MMELVLEIKKIPKTGLEAETIKPENFVNKSIKEIEKIEVCSGNGKITLGSIFKISGKTAKNPSEQKIVIVGDASKIKRIGEAMSGGEILLKGDVGPRLGEFMVSGKIIVEGNADNWIGTSMNGGEIIVKGNAGDYMGSSIRGTNRGMRGGKILVDGNAGGEIGYGMVGGEITINGTADSFVGSYMRGGKIVVGNVLMNRIGFSMNGGEISIIDKTFNVPFYFRKIGEEGGFMQYSGDQSFDGKGLLKVQK